MNFTRRAGIITAIALAVAAPLLVAHRSDDAASAETGDGDDSVSVDAPDVDRPLADSVSNGKLRLPDGSYEMVGYGTVLVVDGDEITPHYVTRSTCTRGESFDNELDVDHAVDDGGQIIVDLVGPTTDYRLSPLIDAPACASDATDSLTALDEAFSTHYPFFDERGTEWSSSIARIRDVVEAGSSTADALAAFMVELGDGHTLITGFDVDIDVAAFGVDGIDSVADLADLLDTELDATFSRLGDVSVDPLGNVAWGRFADHPETGYLYIDSFHPDSFESGDEPRDDRDALVAALDLAISDLGTSEHLIVDVRYNAGGHEDLAVIAAGYFVDEPTDAYRKWAHAEPDPAVQTITVTPQSAHFDGDVTILTSPATASAAEAFLLAMRAATDAAIVGAPSFGEFSDAIDWQLPDGTEFTMSMEVYTDLDGNNFEAVGVPADRTVPFNETIDAVFATAPEE